MRDALVGADSIRPNVTGVSCPLNGTARSALGSTSGGAGSPNGLTEGVRYGMEALQKYARHPLRPSARTGAPLPEGEARALRAADAYFLGRGIKIRSVNIPPEVSTVKTP